MLKLKCKICDCEFLPTIDKHYTARDNGESGVATVLKNTEGNLYDTFDCPSCGCQMIVQERKRVYVPSTSLTDSLKDNKEDDDEQTT